MLTDQELQRLRNQANECEQAADEIVELRAERDALLASAPRWIACSERMPESDRQVIVYFSDCFTDGQVWQDCWSGEIGGEWDSRSDGEHRAVTHWMPLPEAPSGEGGER